MELTGALKRSDWEGIESSKFIDLNEALHHGVLVSKLARLLSEKLEMDSLFTEEMANAGMLHDIGKLRLSDYLYGRRQDTLQIEELRYVRMHSQLSYEILKQYDYSEELLMAIYHHHENYDGSGYPDNLKGREIPQGARILRACDVFAALISVRPYREAFDMETALDLMIDEVKNFDMKVFLAFMDMIHSKDFMKIIEYVEQINSNAMVAGKEQ